MPELSLSSRISRTSRVTLLAAVATGCALAACQESPPPASPPTYAAPGYPPPAYGPTPATYPTAQARYGAPTQPQYAPAPQQPAPAPAPAYAPAPAPTYAPAANRPLLGPLIGPIAWQAEVRAVARELVSDLEPDYRQRVINVPIVFDPNPNDVNAFASCDDKGAPFVAGTEGLLDAIDAISETRATDELFGTRTYDTYAGAVVPRMVTKASGSALLPLGIIPPQYLADPRRISRAHEIFDETVAFTFGHELAHQYLGHTGCAMGQANPLAQAAGALGEILTSGPPGMNQPNEAIADNFGVRSTLDAGRARSASAYAWSDGGALLLLDFFGRLRQASGANPLLSVFLSHPDPSVRIPLVQAAAASWHLQHPG